MASPELTVGDTYPALRASVVESDAARLMPLPEAESLLFLAVPKGSGDVFEGEAEAIDPPEDVGSKVAPLGYNLRYPLAGDDTAVTDHYTPWLKVTWAPGKTEWVRVQTGDQIVIGEAPE